MEKIQLEIKGSVPSKKNSKQLFRNSRTGKNFITSSDNFKQWHEEQSYLIKPYRPAAPFKKCGIFCFFYLPDNRRGDLENKFSSIADLLVELGFIEDDTWQCLSVVNLQAVGIDKENPRVTVVIANREK